MKIVDLKCPSCGGKLAPMEGNPKIVVCEYCNSQFVLEEDQVVNYHIHQYDSTPRPIQNDPSKTCTSSVGPVAGIISVAIIGIISFVGVFMANSNKPKETARWETGITVNSQFYDMEKEEAAAQEEALLQNQSPLYEEILKSIFQKSPDLVTEQDLEKVKYISVHKGGETAKVEYSFDDPYGDGEFRILTLTLEPLDWEVGDLARFPSLVKVDLSYGWPSGDVLKGMEHLKGLTCSNMEISEIADRVEPGQILELELDGTESLEGLSAFENLEILTLEDVPAPDIRQITPLKNLKTLYIEEEEAFDPFSQGSQSGALTDYSGLSVITSLESLHLQSESLREFSFLKPLTNLTSLSIEESEAISLEPLAELSQLTSLRLVDNNSVNDYSPIGRLTGLESLTIDKSTSQDDPDLSALVQLQSLDMSGFMSVAGVRNLGNLKELSIHGCNIDEIKSLSALSNLESFTCYSVWTYAVPLENVNFIDSMTSLKCLDFCGRSRDTSFGSFQNNMEILGDISNVFNHQGLEELYLNKCMFEIRFDNIRDNPTLRVLEMKDVKLKENFYVRSSGGMTDIWYDDVTLDEHTDFLIHFPSLEQLYLDGNQLTNVSFAASLKSLAHLGINNNYVTDLAPLNQAENLRYLDIRQNPVSSVETGEGVTILK